MKKYRLTGYITVSATTVVEANSPEEALEIAKERPNGAIAINNGYDEEEYWIVSELDGEAQKIYID